MSIKRDIILADTVEFFGHEDYRTIEIFTASERLPEPEYDDTILAIYTTRVREALEGADDDFEEPLEADESGFNPYMGCYDDDC